MDVMLDLETLGKKPGCVVLSIGAVAFEPLAKDLPKPENTGLVFYQNITIFDQLLLGLVVDESTLDWWKSQSEEAKRALTTDKMNLQGSLFRLVTWFGNLPGKTKGKVWAKSPDFDCAVLEEAARRVGVNLPWEYRDKADCRTLAYVGTLSNRIAGEPPPPPYGTAHNALDDCYTQAAQVQYEMGRLSNGQAS